MIDDVYEKMNDIFSFILFNLLGRSMLITVFVTNDSLIDFDLRPNALCGDVDRSSDNTLTISWHSEGNHYYVHVE